MHKYSMFWFAVVLFSISSLVLGAGRKSNTSNHESSKWTIAGHTIGVRYLQEASSLTDGKIMFTGGYGFEYCATTEFFNPSTINWTAGSSMNDCRWYHTSSLISNGMILVAGGYIEDPFRKRDVKYTLNGAELFNPVTGSWTRTGGLNQQRHSHTASVLLNGKVLVAGGADIDFLNSSELYDPSTGNWTRAMNMNWKRTWHEATVLRNGHVLVTGGLTSGDDALNTVEIYDPSTGQWRNASNMNSPRYGHTATLLKNGKVLVAGGLGDDYFSLDSSELFDPLTETWTASGTMNDGRSKHTASLLFSGKVLVAGGGLEGDVFPGFNPVKTAEIYDPITEIWTSTSSMHYTRTWHTASVLENGNVLVVGGNMDNDTSVYTPEIYDASTNSYLLLNGGKKRVRQLI